MITPYKNLIFQILLNHPLGVDNFDIIEKEPVFSIIYKPFSSKFHYTIYQTEFNFHTFNSNAINYTPGFKSYIRTREQTPFREIINDFEKWLQNDVGSYIRDQETVDLWAQYKKRAIESPLQILDYEDVTNFNDFEKQTLKLGLNELKYTIADRFKANDEQMHIVNNRLNYLIEAVERTNKIDFQGILINTIISITIALTLDSSKGQELFNLFVQILQFKTMIGK